MSADQIKIVIDADTREAIANLSKLKDTIGDVEKAESKLSTGQAVWKALNSDVGKLSSQLATAHPRIAAIGGSLGRIAAGTGAVVAGVAAGAMQLGRMAAEADNLARAERLLGGAMDAVRTATLDTVTAQDALRVQQGLVQSGLNVTSEQLGSIAARARQFALATGTETPQALDQMLGSLRGLEAEGLRQFGVTLNSTGDRQRDFNTVVQQFASGASDAEREARKWGTALTQTNQSARDLNASLRNQRTMGEEVERTSRAFSSMTNNIAAALAQALNLNDVFKFWSDMFDRGAAARNQRQDAQRMQGDAAAIERRNAISAIGRMRQRGLNVRTLEEYAGRADTSLDDLARIRAYSNNADSATAPVAQRMFDALASSLPGVQAMQRAQQQEAARAATAAETERKIRKLGQAAEGSASALTNVQRAAARGLRARGGVNPLSNEEFSDLLGQLAAPTEAELNEESARRGKAEAAFAEERATMERDSARQQRRFERDRQTRVQSVSQGRTVGAGIQRGLGVSADALETEAKLTQGYADTIIGSFDKIGAAITKHVELVASGQETLGQAVLAGTHEVTKAIAMEALPRSLMELAAGFAALANPVTAATAPLHFTAAAVYGGVAAGAGLVAGVTGALGGAGAPAAAAGATGTARAASGTTPPAREESAAPVSIYLNSTVPPGPRELQTLVNATRQSSRYQLDSRAQMVPRQVRA